MAKTEVKEKTKKPSNSNNFRIQNFFVNELKEYSHDEGEIEMDDYSR